MKKTLDLINKNIYLLILIIGLFVFAILNIYDLKIADAPNIKLMFMIFLGISIITSLVLIFIKFKLKDNFNIPKIYLITCLLLGIVYIFLSPLFTGSDEHNHYYRIYEISEGVFITPTDNNKVGSILPASLKETFQIAGSNNTMIKYHHIKDMMSIKMTNEVMKYGNDFADSYSNTALYSPIQYIPQVLGFSLGKVFNATPYTLGMLGRIFNLLFYALIGFMALKIIPKGKMVVMLILLSPNMLQCATTLSADAFTNVIFLLLIALIFSCLNAKDKITFRKEAALFILAITISLCKIVYLPVVFLLFLIPKDKYKNSLKEKNIFCLLTIIFSIIVSLLWMNTTNNIFEIAYVQSNLQKEFIFHNLIEYIIILMRTFVIEGFHYFECLLVGTTMYHTQLNIPTLFSLFYNIVVILAYIYDDEKLEINNLGKWSIALITLTIIGLISSAIYIQCTANFYSVGNNIVGGIQGRYFVPILFLIIFLIESNKKKIFGNYNYLMTIIFSSAIVWLYMLTRFIV